MVAFFIGRSVLKRVMSREILSSGFSTWSDINRTTRGGQVIFEQTVGSICIEEDIRGLIKR